MALMFSKREYNFQHKIEKLRCPVGGEVLGERKLHEDKLLFCRDCGWKYHWAPQKTTPVPVRATKGSGVQCGCGRCGR